MASPKAAAAPARLDEPKNRRLPFRPLAVRLARGDRRAFEQLFRDHHQEIYRFCLALLRDRGDAEDAMQATMAAALRSLPGERREIAIRPWLFRVARNEAISIARNRRERPLEEAELDEQIGEAKSPEQRLEERDRLRSLVTDLQALPERQRTALLMRELSDLPYPEIAAALGCREGTARQAVHEARSALAERKAGRTMDCETVRRAIDDGDRRRLRGRRIAAHLSACDECADFKAAIEVRREDLRALCPALPLAAGGGVLATLLGGGAAKAALGGGAVGAAGAGAGAGGAAAGGAAVGGGVLSAATVKAASVAAAVVVAAGAADGAGVVELPGPIDLGKQAERPAPEPASSQSTAPQTPGVPTGAADRPGSARAQQARSQGVAASSKRDANRSDRSLAGGRSDGKPGGAEAAGRGKGQARGKGTPGDGAAKGGSSSRQGSPPHNAAPGRTGPGGGPPAHSNSPGPGGPGAAPGAGRMNRPPQSGSKASPNPPAVPGKGADGKQSGQTAPQ